MSVNFKQKFPIQSKNGGLAIKCLSDMGALFGVNEIGIRGDGSGLCRHSGVYKLPRADGNYYPALNGG